MKRILVPTDFSDAANNAAEYAVHLAKEINAKVLLLHVFHVPIPPTESPIIVYTSDELQKDNEVALKKLANRLKKNTTVEISCKAVMGMAAEEILEEEKKSNLIVMGMKGAGKLSELILGSITTATLRKATIPTLVIPEKIKFKAPKKIVFACDYDSKTDYNTIEPLKELVQKFDSKLFVLNVKNKKNGASMEEAGAGLRLENKLSDTNHIYYFSENNDLVSGINDFVKEKKADMIVTIPHRHNILERLFHESNSKKIAFHTSIPLLTLPDNHKSLAAYFL